jgi:hypothetical protein
LNFDPIPIQERLAWLLKGTSFITPVDSIHPTTPTGGREKIQMDLLVFIPTMDKPGRRLQKVIGNLVWQGTIEIFRTIKKISSRLRHLTGEETVVILLVSSTT